MKKRAAWFLFICATVLYIFGSIRLMFLIERDLKLPKNEEEETIWNFGNLMCHCNADTDSIEAKKPIKTMPWERTSSLERTLTLNDNMCHLSQSQEIDHTSDIHTYNLLEEIKITYPQYIYTHTGWLQQLDTTYDAHAWDNEPLKVFVVPFSHHDPGWKSTVDSYYDSWTKYTLSVALRQLSADPEMKFVWAEIVFLHRWYTGLKASSKAEFVKILKSGQFEILTGGWVMTDEAVAHYWSMIDQLVEGQQWLASEFNYTVKHAWAIDPFGHSSTMPYLLKKSGIENMLIQRVHYAMKKHLGERKNLEFTWRQSWSASSDTDIHCHLTPFMLYNIVYSCGPNIEVCCWMDFTKNKCWSWGKYVEPEKINTENVRKKSLELLDQFRKKAQFQKHNIVLLPQGDDFRFTSDSNWAKHFRNLKKLFQYMNNDKEMHIQIKYSTLGEYFEASKKALLNPKAMENGAPQRLPVLSGDFFTYTDRDDQYWSGYYTTRPYLKYMTRVLQARLRATEILFSYSAAQCAKKQDTNMMALLKGSYEYLKFMRQNNGLLQHHDAITGTATAEVVQDYLSRIIKSLKYGNKLIKLSTSFLLNKQVQSTGDDFRVLEGHNFMKGPPGDIVLTRPESIVVLFNPLAVFRQEIVKVNVASMFLVVFDMADNHLPCQVTPVFGKDLVIDDHLYVVYFTVNIAPLAYSQYKIKEVDRTNNMHGKMCDISQITLHSSMHNHRQQSAFPTRWSGLSDYVIENPHIRASFCKCSGLLQKIRNKSTGKSYRTEVNFVIYHTGSWTNPFRDKSGAYIFMPDGEARVLNVKVPQVAVVKGVLVSLVYTRTLLATQTVTLYNISSAQGYGIHIDNSVDITSKNNSELGMRLKSNIINSPGPIFYTDLNGFQYVKRKTYSKLPIQGNVYPMTSMVFIEDDEVRLTIHSFQSHGVSSQRLGWVEIMLDRRLNQDDWRGLNQGVTDNVVGTPSHFILTLQPNKKPVRTKSYNAFPSLLGHALSNLMMNPLIQLQNLSPKSKITPAISLASAELPCDTNLINLKVYGNPIDFNQLSFLLILHRVGIDCQVLLYPNSVKCDGAKGHVNLSNIFPHTLKYIHQTSLSGTHVVKQVNSNIVFLDPMELQSYNLALHFNS